VMSAGSGGGRGGADESVTYVCVCVCVCVCVRACCGLAIRTSSMESRHARNDSVRSAHAPSITPAPITCCTCLRYRRSSFGDASFHGCMSNRTM
jgi:hypothetical protein